LLWVVWSGIRLWRFGWEVRAAGWRWGVGRGWEWVGRRWRRREVVVVGRRWWVEWEGIEVEEVEEVAVGAGRIVMIEVEAEVEVGEVSAEV
jgi:hypothetical protein